MTCVALSNIDLTQDIIEVTCVYRLIDAQVLRDRNNITAFNNKHLGLLFYCRSDSQLQIDDHIQSEQDVNEYGIARKLTRANTFVSVN